MPRYRTAWTFCFAETLHDRHVVHTHLPTSSCLETEPVLHGKTGTLPSKSRGLFHVPTTLTEGKVTARGPAIDCSRVKNTSASETARRQKRIQIKMGPFQWFPYLCLLSAQPLTPTQIWPPNPHGTFIQNGSKGSSQEPLVQTGSNREL